MDTLAKRVKAARARMGMRQEDLAQASGLKQGDISKIENGKILKTTGVVALARALRCDPNWLGTGEGEMVSANVWPFALLRPDQVQALTPKELAMVEKLALDLLAMRPPQAHHANTALPPKAGSAKTWELSTRRNKRSGKRDTDEEKRQSGGG